MHSQLNNVTLELGVKKKHQFVPPSIDGTRDTSLEVAIPIWVEMNVHKSVKKKNK